MLCQKCGRAIEKDFRFCPWCSTIVEENTLIKGITSLELVELVGKQKKYEQALRDMQAELAFRIRNAFRKKGYLEKYASFEDYGQSEFGFGKAALFMYKYVGEDFIDDNGNWLIAKGEEWGVAKLYELHPLCEEFPLDFINAVIEDGNLLNPEHTLGQIRKEVKALRKARNKLKLPD